MARARLMDTPEDYERLGVKPGPVERWEDRRRSGDDSDEWEWWYFDAILDDGTAVVVQFFPLKAKRMFSAKSRLPTVWLKVTLPDGTHYEEEAKVTLDDTHYGTEQCDVRFGPHSFTGDLQKYRIVIAPINGLAADLTLNSLSKPFRPGSSYFGFGDDDAKYYTWLCAVPKGKVTGTLTYAGQTVEVTGYGYHDHQWGNFILYEAWNNWLWARQRYDDYTMVVFDMISTGEYGFTRFPICFVQNSKGDLVFQNTDGAVEYEVLDEYLDAASGKGYPTASRYRFEQNGTAVDYTLRAERTIEAADAYAKAPQQIKASLGRFWGPILGPAAGWLVRRMLRSKGIRPSYQRYQATGDLRITRGDITVERSAELIFEFMYQGSEPYRQHV